MNGVIHSISLFTRVATSPVPHGARLLLVSGRIPVLFDNKPRRNRVVLHFWGSPHGLLSNKTGILPGTSSRRAPCGIGDEGTPVKGDILCTEPISLFCVSVPQLIRLAPQIFSEQFCSCSSKEAVEEVCVNRKSRSKLGA